MSMKILSWIVSVDKIKNEMEKSGLNYILTKVSGFSV